MTVWTSVQQTHPSLRSDMTTTISRPPPSSCDTCCSGDAVATVHSRWIEPLASSSIVPVCWLSKSKPIVYSVSIQLLKTANCHFSPLQLLTTANCHLNFILFLKTANYNFFFQVVQTANYHCYRYSFWRQRTPTFLFNLFFEILITLISFFP